MRFSIFLLSALSSTSLAATNYIHNNCNFDVYFSSVSTGSAPTPQKLSPGSYTTEDQYYNGTGTAIKITRTAEGLYTSQPVLHFSYSYHPNVDIYYDLSSSFGFGFWGKKVALDASEAGAQDLVWTGEPKPNYTAHYTGETDLTLTLCAEWEKHM